MPLNGYKLACQLWIEATIDKLESILNYSFKNRGILKEALTHRYLSALNYERLEFLGYIVLGNFTYLPSLKLGLHQQFLQTYRFGFSNRNMEGTGQSPPILRLLKPITTVTCL
jgi:hypothetical protein